MSIRILLVDDHRIVREGLRALLEPNMSVEVLGEASDGREAVEAARKLFPDIVIMEVVLPRLSGPLVTKQILAELPQTRVLALSVHCDVRYVSDMLNAGASAYLPKTCSLEELTRAIELVASGRKYLSPEITGEVIRDYIRGEAGIRSSARADLTDRELEVLQLLAEGETSKQIAAGLHVSVKTVTAHRQNIMRKLGIHSVAGLTKYALRRGLTSPES